MAYGSALRAQRAVHQAVLEQCQPPTLLLVEHDPVITCNRRRGAGPHLKADPATLARLGIALHLTDRGGDITYHGPGQIVAYPIIRLMPLKLSVGAYMRRLEQIALEAVSAFGVSAERLPGCTGIWVRGQPFRKLCAFGVRVRRNVTMHGLALNVDPDMTHFATIVACGLTDKGVTSLRELLGDRCPSMAGAKAALVERARHHLGGGRHREAP